MKQYQIGIKICHICDIMLIWLCGGFFFCTSQEICFCWIDFMALLIYIHVLYVLAIWQKINGKDWGLKKIVIL